MRQASTIVVAHAPVDLERLAEHHALCQAAAAPNTRGVYVTGALFFASVSTFLDAVKDVTTSDHLVLSLRGMPTLDHMGVEAIRDVVDRQRQGGGDVHLAGVQSVVLVALRRAGLLEHLGRERVHRSVDGTILAVRRKETHPAPRECRCSASLLQDQQSA